MGKFRLKAIIFIITAFLLGLTALPYHADAVNPPLGAYPVIYIPGIMGSVSTELFNNRITTITFPGWPPIPPVTVDFTEWRMLTVPDITSHQDLERVFAAKGLTQANGYFNYFPYDWRKPNAETATGAGNSLLSKIDEVKARTGKAKVNIVAHSMGGLVARAYIQSPQYRGDVHKLALVGTPHKGAVEAYYIWEGGKVNDPVKKAILLAVLASYDGTMDGWTYIHTYTPSVKELLPTFDYLKNFYTGSPIWESSMVEQNLWLKGLNDGINQLLASGVEIRCFVGNYYRTPKYLKVRPHKPWLDGDRWVDGYPLVQGNSAYGDNTVLKDSAGLPGVPMTIGLYKHQDLPGRFAAKIVSFILY